MSTKCIPFRAWILFRWICATIIAILINHVEGSAQPVPIQSSEAAIAKARQFAGNLNAGRPPTLRVPLATPVISIVDTTTPFVAPQLHGRRAWMVLASNVILDVGSYGEYEESARPRDFRFLIDSATGLLIEIQSVRAGDPWDQELKDRAGRLEAERQLSTGLNELYVFPPDSAVSISLQEAFAGIRLPLFSASFITAKLLKMEHLITASPMRKITEDYLDSRDFWCINSYGVAFRKTHMRAIVDAHTGDIFLMSNHPIANFYLDDSVKATPIRRMGRGVQVMGAPADSSKDEQ